MNSSYPVSPAPDDGWFCPACHSLNRAGVSRCYSCRANTPLVDSTAPASRNRGWVGILLVIALVLAGLGGSVVFGRTTAAPLKPADSPNELIALISDGNTLSTGDSEASDSVTPSAAAPTMSIPEATLTPQPTATPTPRPTATPIPAATAAPTDPPADTVALPRFSYPVTGATVKYFSIAGDTPSALLKADVAASSKACNMEDSMACFSPGYSWRFFIKTKVTSGGCANTSIEISSNYTIILPNWTSPARVPAGLVAWWKLVMDHIVWHESQHLAIAQEYAPKIKAALLSAPCTAAGFNAAGQAVLDDITAAQAAFDAQQNATVWEYPPYSGPWR